MALVQESDGVLNVTLGQDGQWHVTSENSSQLLASFDDPKSAAAWAIQRAKPNQGRVLVDEIPIKIPAV
jgi:hypothetical protein